MADREVAGSWDSSMASAPWCSGWPTTTPSPGASRRRSTARAPWWASRRWSPSSRSASGRWRNDSGATFIEPCDVQKDEDIERVFARWSEVYGSLDILIHAVAFANRDELGGEFIRTSREGFRLAHDVSAYSLVALAREARPLMSQGGAILTLTYYGAEKVVTNYNVMGVAKASLEACVRYLAVDLGKEGIRVNAISAGPMRTLAASGVTGFKKMHRLFNEIAPLRRPLSIDDLGNAAVYLCSDMSRGTTGEIHYVDGGYNIIGVPEVVD